MGKETAPDFADVLSYTIEHHYDSAEHFAKVAGTVGSSVSRWSNRKGLPSLRMIEQMAPHIFDRRRKPIPADVLIALAYPRLATGGSGRVSLTAPSLSNHLARELDQMLDTGSPVPHDKREVLASLVDAVMNPYRTYLRKRKSA